MRIQWKAGLLGCALGLLAAATTATAEAPRVEAAGTQACCDSCVASYNNCMAYCSTNPYPNCASNCQKGLTNCYNYSCGGC
jgi:hypothetical protein